MFIRDLSLSAFEASLVLIISQVPFVMLVINYVIANEDSSLDLKTILRVISDNVRSGEVLAYIASLLASTMVYFILRPRLFLYRTIICLLCVLIPFTLIYLATPTYLADRYGKAANHAFLGGYSLTLLFASLAIWVFSIFHQRRIESSSPYLAGDEPAKKIIQKISAGGSNV